MRVVAISNYNKDFSDKYENLSNKYSIINAMRVVLTIVSDAVNF